MQSTIVDGPKTFTAGEDLLEYRRVKVKSGSTTNPPEVVYADAGEQAIGITLESADNQEKISVQLFTKDGTLFGVAADTFAYGAILYGAADGKISDTSSGSAIGIALEAATAAGDIVEWMPFAVLSTTAGTVSIADAGAFTTAATVEAALAEIYQHLLSSQKFIPVPLTSLLESDGTNVVAALGNATTPILDMINGDTDSSLQLAWAAGNVDSVLFQTPLPPDLDVTADIVIHFRAKMADANDTPTIASDAYFNEGDTKIEDVSAALGSTYAEKTITIAAADVPDGAQTLTVELTPGAHDTDILYMSAIWIEYTAKVLTA